MTVFFLLVGLEIKRELLTGELRDRRRAAMPAVAALGGMLVPAAIYLAFTAGTDATEGFGIAMPTDIVFALAVLTLARNAPAGLKALLLTLAIVDDLGSIVVVAFVDSSDVDGLALAVALGIFVAFAVLWRIGVRAVVVYVVLALASWVALDAGGVAPTLAGVVIAFLTPAVAFQRPRHVSAEAHRVADLTLDEPDPPDADAAQWLDLARMSREAVSPLARAEALLLPWSSHVVVPLFALANAGVRLSGHAVAEAASSRLGLGILTSRIVGKPLGIALAVLVALRLGLGTLPEGVRRGHVVAVGAIAGIPFTVSLFVAELALPARLVEPATVAIIARGGRGRARRLPPAPTERGRAGARARSVAGQLTDDSLYLPGPGPPHRSGAVPKPEEVATCCTVSWRRKAVRSTPSSGRSRPTRCG